MQLNCNTSNLLHILEEAREIFFQILKTWDEWMNKRTEMQLSFLVHKQMEMKESLSFCQLCLWTLFHEASKKAFCVRGQQAGLHPSATQGGGNPVSADGYPRPPPRRWELDRNHGLLTTVVIEHHPQLLNTPELAPEGNTGESQSSTALWGGVGSWVLAELSENTTWNSCYLCSPHVCQLPVPLASLLGDGNLVFLKVSFIYMTLDLLFLSRAKKNDTVKDSKYIEDVLTSSLLTLFFFKSLPV